MTTSRPLHRLTISGLTSVRDLTLELKTDVTVVIGANGSGKSNVVGALEILSRVVEGTVQEHLLHRGNLDQLLFVGADGPVDHATLKIMGLPDDSGLANGYAVTLSPSDDGSAVLSEQLIVHDTKHYATPYDRPLSPARQSHVPALTSGQGDYPQKLRNFAAYVSSLMAGTRVFHFDDVSHDAPPKRTATIGDDLSLRWDAGNLAAYLYRVRESNRYDYDRIISTVQRIAPFFEDFVLEPMVPGSESIRLRWRQRGLDRVFTAGQLSDGTLRFICLATLLLTEDRPATIVLDEPELGLHPAAIHLLAALVRSAATDGHRVLMATQSVPLLSEFSLEEVAVVDRIDGATTVSRPNRDELQDFLQDYSLGSMWEMNLLHGRPGTEFPHPSTGQPV